MRIRIKCVAKVLLFFDMTKYFGKKMQKKCIFLNISVFFSTFATHFMRIRMCTIFNKDYKLYKIQRKNG